MKKLIIFGTIVLALWLAVSYAMLWPPICFYAGESGESCVNRLRQINGAKQQLALQTGRTSGRVSPADLEKYLNHPLTCPSGGTYYFGSLGEDPVCSFGTSSPPSAVKERVGFLGWRWKTWPSRGSASHKLPNL